jgi:hypothetical protein
MITALAPVTVLVPVTEAALFTLGCIAIHALRKHADAVTAMLACFVTLLVLMIGIVCAPEPFSRYQTAGLADFALADQAAY